MNQIEIEKVLLQHAGVRLRTTLDIERPILDPMATVIVVEIDGEKVERAKS